MISVSSFFSPSPTHLTSEDLGEKSRQRPSGNLAWEMEERGGVEMGEEMGGGDGGGDRGDGGGGGRRGEEEQGGRTGVESGWVKREREEGKRGGREREREVEEREVEGKREK